MYFENVHDARRYMKTGYYIRLTVAKEELTIHAGLRFLHFARNRFNASCLAKYLIITPAQINQRLTGYQEYARMERKVFS